MDYRHQEIRKAFPGSCTWIFHNESYQKWINEDRGLLWIKGKPGSGKSTVIKRILDSFAKQKAFGQIQLYFFFHRRGDPLQYTQLGMLRTILYQLLSQVASVRRIFNTAWEEKTRVQGGERYARNWQLEELRDLFSSLLLAATEDGNIRIFVDALDEAGEEPAKDLLSYFYGLSDEVRESEACVSICFSCRKYPVFANNSGLEIWVDNGNYNDITAYTVAELDRQLVKDSSHQNVVDVLQADFARKASGVFLWASLMIPVVVKQYNDGEYLESIRQRLNRVPSDLSHIYEYILTKVVDPEKRLRTLRLMQWIFLAERPLSHLEIHHAIASDDFARQSPQYLAKSLEDLINTDTQIEKSILSLSGGLAEIKYDRPTRRRKSRVQFIHESVNDFLRKDKFKLLSFAFRSDPIGESHYRLCLSCLNYLRVSSDILPGKGYEELIELVKRFPLTEYAVTSWLSHAEKAELRGLPLDEVLQCFEWPSDKLFRRWCQLYQDLVRMDDDRCFKRGVTLLHVAASLNLQSLMRALLENGADVDQSDIDGATALTFAAAYHHDEVATNKASVQLLLEYGADVKAPQSRFRDSPLSTAAESGDEAVVRLLVDKGADVNACNAWIPSDTNVTPLQAAARSESDSSVAITRFLLDNGADIKATSGSIASNALYAAVGNKNRGVAQLLLERGAGIDGPFDSIDLLQIAVNVSDESIVRLLLENGADVNAVSGGHKETALVRAAEYGSDTMLRLLLEAGANFDGIKGRFGTLYQLARKSRTDSKAKIQLLLKYGYGRRWVIRTGFTLEKTAKQGSEAVLRLLLRAKVVDSSGDDYNALLQLAKRSETDRDGKVKLLLLYKYGSRWLNRDWVSAVDTLRQSDRASDESDDSHDESDN